MERLHETATFRKGESTKLQLFADVCADVNSQTSVLPGLACLNYPNIICPIVDALPDFLQSKWEKIVVDHAEDHHESYPGFDIFNAMIQNQAKLKNHPNLLAGETTKPKDKTKEEDKTSQRTAYLSETKTSESVQI